MTKLRDISGQQFGKLTAQHVHGKDSTGKTMWLCHCQCGNKSVHTMLNLVKGVAKSCGCSKAKSPLRHDLSKSKYGRLQPVAPVDGLRWLCICDCGKTTVARTVHLTRNHTRSCGCLAAEKKRSTTDGAATAARNTWAKEVKQKVEAKCEVCHREDLKLHAHHIIPFSVCADLAFNVDNGVVLCKECHWEVHRRINDGVHFGEALITQYEQKSPYQFAKEISVLLREDPRQLMHYLQKLIELTEAK